MYFSDRQQLFLSIFQQLFPLIRYLSFIESGLRLLVFHADVFCGVVVPPSPKNARVGGYSLLRLYRSVPESRASRPNVCSVLVAWTLDGL